MGNIFSEKLCQFYTRTSLQINQRRKVHKEQNWKFYFSPCNLGGVRNPGSMLNHAACEWLPLNLDKSLRQSPSVPLSQAMCLNYPACPLSVTSANLSRISLCVAMAGGAKTCSGSHPATSMCELGASLFILKHWSWALDLLGSCHLTRGISNRHSAYMFFGSQDDISHEY